MLVNEIKDGHGNGHKLKVNKEGTIGVVPHLHPPINDPIFVIPFVSFFENDAGSNDMQVAASLASPSAFFIEATADTDIYIKTISFEITDVNAVLNKFGNITALTNGVRFEWVTQDKGTTIIDATLQTNFDFVRLCGGMPAFGSGNDSFKANNVSGNSEGYIPILNVELVFGITYGFRLRKGTTDKLQFVVQDDTTGVDSFNIKAFGQLL